MIVIISLQRQGGGGDYLPGAIQKYTASSLPLVPVEGMSLSLVILS